MRTFEQAKLENDEFEKRFNRHKKIFKVVFILVATMILLIWTVMGVSFYKTVSIANQQDWSNGIKPVVEKVWCGKPGCLNMVDN